MGDSGCLFLDGCLKIINYPKKIIKIIIKIINYFHATFVYLVLPYIKVANYYIINGS